MARTHILITRILLISIVIAPVALGLAASVMASIGIFPAIGARLISFAPWYEFFAYPALAQSVFVSFFSALIALGLALPFALIIAQSLHKKQPKWMLAILAAPHSAIAIGFAFLIAPSGWFMRILGFESPPQIVTIGDPYGLALGLGLAIKELPFLIVVITSLLTTMPMRVLEKTASSLGYDQHSTWVKLITPQLIPLMRLPIFITFVYALTSVDMALVLGPSSPPPISLLLMRWFNDSDITQLLVASAGSIFLMIMVGIGAILGWLVERAVIGQILKRSEKGQRHSLFNTTLFNASRAIKVIFVIGVLALLANLIWSFSWRWSFPNLFPESYSLIIWGKILAQDLDILFNTFGIAIIASLFSLALAISWLEISRTPRWDLVFMIPLFIPQISFLFGFNAWLNYFRLSPLFAIIWTHIIFIFPYMLIILAAPWRDIDPRFIKTARTLGKAPITILFMIKIPMRFSAIMLALAVGIAVSVAQYLPTLFAGGGRIDTITTEALTLASGSDRRLTGAYALMQSLLPLLAFAFAGIVPRIVFRNRRAMLGGGRI